MNRRMPNGMYGGVRGERKSPLLDSVRMLEKFSMEREAPPQAENPYSPLL